LVDELLKRLASKGIQCQGYADDIVIIARGRFEETLCDIIQLGLRMTSDWCNEVGLNLNPAKTVIVPFTRRYKLQKLRHIRLSGSTVAISKEVKYLGVTFDSKLNFGLHVKNAIAKCTRALYTCRSIAGKSWGTAPKILRWLYVMVVRPMLTYGAIAWGGRVQLITVQKQLQKLQRMACVCITGAMRTCPTVAIEVLMELTPLHKFIELQRKATLLRMAMEGVGNNCILSQRDADMLSGELPLLVQPRDEMAAEYKFERNFQVNLSSKRDWTTLEEVHPMKLHTIKWYTDGSLTCQGTGLGVIGPRVSHHESLGTYTSIFQAEVCAIGRCADFNLKRNYRNRDIAILSDSQAALKAISNAKITSKVVREVRTKLDLLGSDNRLTLRWIPGHKDIAGNEAADRLARRGAEEHLIGPEPFCGIGNHTIRESLRDEERHLRQLCWVNTQGLRQAKGLLGNYNLKRFKQLISMGKNRLRILTGLLTGHCRLRSHLYKLGIVSSGNCRYCDIEEESSEHIVATCAALSRRRCRILGNHIIQPKDIAALSPTKILEFIQEIGLAGEL